MNEVELKRLEEFALKVGLLKLFMFLHPTFKPKGLTDEYASYLRDIWIAYLNYAIKYNELDGLSVESAPEGSVSEEYNTHLIWFVTDPTLNRKEQSAMSRNIVALIAAILREANCTLNYPIADYVEVLKACLEGRDWLPLFELMQSDFNKNLKKKKKAK